MVNLLLFSTLFMVFRILDKHEMKAQLWKEKPGNIFGNFLWGHTVRKGQNHPRISKTRRQRLDPLSKRRTVVHANQDSAGDSDKSLSSWHVPNRLTVTDPQFSYSALFYSPDLTFRSNVLISFSTAVRNC
jgi:hypothetical protein